MQSLERVSCNLTDLVRRCFFTGFVGEKFVEENSKDFYDPKGEIRFTICDTSDSEDELPYETEQVNKRKAGKVVEEKKNKEVEEKSKMVEERKNKVQLRQPHHARVEDIAYSSVPKETTSLLQEAELKEDKRIEADTDAILDEIDDILGKKRSFGSACN